jgi:cell division protein FtsL
MTQTAYDLRDRTQTHYRAPRVRVVKGGRMRLEKLRQAAMAMRFVLLSILVLGLVVSLLYSQATISALSSEIESTRQELLTAQSTYDYLSGEMDDITSTTNIAAIAQGELGLVKADPSQITYIDLESEGLIRRNESNLSRLLSGFQTAALSLIDSFDP